ncbi:MAG: hypothetical protein ACT4O5_09230 [Gammaproteobacteria bacterium]
MTSITPKQARDYLDRWKLVEEVEANELRTVSMETKLRQLAVLMASRNLFGDDRDRETRVREVRNRWTRIRAALHG